MIDYKLLYKAVKYFGKNGFTQIEVPWRVSKEAINCTFDSNLSFKSDDKFLIGSAEQGLIELILNNQLNSSMIMSVSPCFRNEKEDYYHQQEFMKLELMYLSNSEITNDYVNFKIFRQIVLGFLTKELRINASDIVIKETDDNISLYSEDILINGIEYSSYGIRTINGKYYIYGIGIALPRASKILAEVIKVKNDSVYKKIKKELKKALNKTKGIKC